MAQQKKDGKGNANTSTTNARSHTVDEQKVAQMFAKEQTKFTNLILDSDDTKEHRI